MNNFYVRTSQEIPKQIRFQLFFKQPDPNVIDTTIEEFLEPHEPNNHFLDIEWDRNEIFRCTFTQTKSDVWILSHFFRRYKFFDKEYRGKSNLGPFMLNYAIQTITNIYGPMKELHLIVTNVNFLHRANDSLICYYESLGFRVHGTPSYGETMMIKQF